MPKYIDAWELNEIVTRKSYPVQLKEGKSARGITLTDFKHIVAQYPGVSNMGRPRYGEWDCAGNEDWICSNCMNMIHFEGHILGLPKFCMNCGAKMRAGDLDADI